MPYTSVSSTGGTIDGRCYESVTAADSATVCTSSQVVMDMSRTQACSGTTSYSIYMVRAAAARCGVVRGAERCARP